MHKAKDSGVSVKDPHKWLSRHAQGHVWQQLGEGPEQIDAEMCSEWMS